MIAETKTYKGYTIKINQDDVTENPREAWDNLGVMVCFHRRYNMGDTDHGYRWEDYEGWDALEKEITRDHGDSIILPIYLYDHSGQTISTTPFSCQWDSGRLGLIFLSLQKARKEYGWKKITKKRRAQLEKYLQGEVKVYDSYIRGDVYGFEVVSPEGEDILHSCWGFYGDYEESGLMEDARRQIDWDISQKRKAHFEKVKAWIRNKVSLIYREPLGAC